MQWLNPTWSPTNISRTSLRNTSDAEDIGFKVKIPKERYISPERQQQILDELKVI